MNTPGISFRSKRPKSPDPELASAAPDNQSPRKKRRDCNPSEPPNFWDSLSRIWLTSNALRELNRRNNLCTPPPVDTAPSLHVRSKAQAAAIRPETALLRFARHGGPDLSDLCNFGEFTMPASQGRGGTRGQGRPRAEVQRVSSRPKSKPSPYHESFLQLLIDHNVYPPEYKYPDAQRPAKAGNIKELLIRLRLARNDLGIIDEETIERLRDVNQNAPEDRATRMAVYPILEGDARYNGTRLSGIIFSNLDALLPVLLASPEPDLYCGARPEQIDVKVRNHLSGMIEPSDDTTCAAAPNFFLAAKGLEGVPDVLRNQATYQGAIGARAIHALESYNRTPVFDTSIKAISCTYCDGQLIIYGTHILPPGGGGKKHGLTPGSYDGTTYVISMLRGFCLIDDPDTFRRGVTAFRNAMEWAEETRNNAIRMANERNGAGHPIR